MELSSGVRLRCRAVVGADGTKSRIGRMLGVGRAAYAGEVYYRCCASPALCSGCPHAVVHAVLLDIAKRSGHAKGGIQRGILAFCDRGLATFPESVPEPPGTLRMIWGRGVRVGISTISERQCFWFTTKTCPEVCALPSRIFCTEWMISTRVGTRTKVCA